MAGSTSIRINHELYEQARQDAAIEHRSIAGQIELMWEVRQTRRFARQYKKLQGKTVADVDAA